jgi:hypothetical protein
MPCFQPRFVVWRGISDRFGYGADGVIEENMVKVAKVGVLMLWLTHAYGSDRPLAGSTYAVACGIHD